MIFKRKKLIQMKAITVFASVEVWFYHAWLNVQHNKGRKSHKTQVWLPVWPSASILHRSTLVFPSLGLDLSLAIVSRPTPRINLRDCNQWKSWKGIFTWIIAEAVNFRLVMWDCSYQYLPQIFLIIFNKEGNLTLKVLKMWVLHLARGMNRPNIFPDR